MYRNARASAARAATCIFVAVLCLDPAAAAQIDAGRPSVSASPGEPLLGKRAAELRDLLPAVFERNQGQAQAAVRYITRGKGSVVLLTARGAYLRLCRVSGGATVPHTRRRRPEESCRTIAMTFAGSKGARAVRGVDELPGVSNYYGSDPSRWISGVPHFASVHYEGLYPGVGAIFYHREGLLEYDVLLDADADPETVRLRFDGADSLTTDTAGNLLIGVGDQAVRLRRPIVYQDGATGREAIDASYVTDGNEARFLLAAYDHHRKLAIDPVLDYSTYAGGSGNDDAFGIDVDSAGNAYIAGRTDSSDFPLAPGADASPSETNGFVIKLNPSGSALLYSTFIGGSHYDDLNDVAVDSQGRAYVTGETASDDLPVSSGVVQSTFGGGFVPPVSGTQDAWVAGLTSSGGLLFATYLGGSDDDFGSSIVLDASGNLYVTGATSSTNFPVGGTSFQASNRGQSDGFVVKLNSSATSIVYGGYVGGGGNDWSYDIDVDGSGRVAITGETRSTDFPATTGAVSPICQCSNFGGSDAFVTMINAAGTDYVYSTYLGGTANENQLLADSAVAVDDDGKIFACGSTNSPDFPVTSGVLQTSQNGVGFDAFLTKIDPDAAPGSNLVFSTYFGGLGTDGAGAIALDPTGNIYLGGFTTSTDFPVKNAIQVAHADTSQGSNSDAFITVVNPSGSQTLFSTYLGGWSEDSPEDLVLDTANNIYVAGWTRSFEATSPILPGFPVTPGALQSSFASNFWFELDAFVSRISAVVTTSTTTSTTTTTTTTTTTSTSTTTTSTLPGQSCGDPVVPASETGSLALTTASDALYILRAAVGLESCALCTCDVNNDGKISATDALTDLKAAVGLPVTLSCPGC